jgi:hypothetical protein
MGPLLSAANPSNRSFGSSKERLPAIRGRGDFGGRSENSNAAGNDLARPQTDDLPRSVSTVNIERKNDDQI